MENVDENVTEDVIVWFNSVEEHRQVLGMLSFHWGWHQEVPVFAASLASRFKRQCPIFVTRGVERWIVGEDRRDSPWDRWEEGW